MMKAVIALLLTICLLPAAALAEETPGDSGWVNFLLICNEGMNNSGGNAGNTLMVIAMNPTRGKIRLMMFTWDTFVHYEGYDLPQKIDMPYRNNGPEETVKVFNENFGLDIALFMSLNFLNLSSLIDTYGGVDIDVTRAERNALNGMVSSKKETLLAQAKLGELSQMVVESLAKESYLNDFGPDTHLNGLQAVGFGWLQYDSVYNCCEREVEVIAALFESMGQSIAKNVLLYTNESGKPEEEDSRRAINLDDMTEDDREFFYLQMAPVFQMSYNNLTDEDISSISMALTRAAYEAARQGVDIFDTDHMDCAVFPLEATQEYEIVAGAKGHLADIEKNAAAMREFLFSED